MKPLIIYHGNCLDGFTAAWAAWKKFGSEADFLAGFYDKPAPAHDVVQGRDVVLVDFSFKRHVLSDIAEFARSVMVLDHHKTAMQDLEGLSPPKPTWEEHLADVEQFDQHLSYVVAQFDMNRSGAALSWLYFHPQRPLPKLVAYVEDRDLWRFKLPNSRRVNLALFSYPYTFEEFDALHHACMSPDALVGLAAEGQAIERKHNKDVEEIIKSHMRKMLIGGWAVPVVNCNHTYGSDAANMLCNEGWPFAGYYYDTPTGRTFGLRSRKGGVDVQKIAAFYGGGGHENAAGFQLTWAMLKAEGLL